MPEDVERLTAVAGRLLGSGPPRDGGVLVSSPLDASLARGELELHHCLRDWGRVGALDASPGGESVAVGAGAHVGFLPFEGGRLCPPRWRTHLPFDVSWVAVGDTLVWAAGSDGGDGVADEEWDRLASGGFAVLRRDDGTALVTRRFRDPVAWGNGGVAMCRAGGLLCALDRRGALHAFDERSGEPRSSTPPRADRSLGIAHAATVHDGVCFGFNRGGYRVLLASIGG
jgi:hypothetical protein